MQERVVHSLFATSCLNCPLKAHSNSPHPSPRIMRKVRLPFVLKQYLILFSASGLSSTRNFRSDVQSGIQEYRIMATAYGVRGEPLSAMASSESQQVTIAPGASTVHCLLFAIAPMSRVRTRFCTTRLCLTGKHACQKKQGGTFPQQSPDPR